MKNLKERMGVDHNNPYWKSNISFWIFVFVVAIFFILAFSYIIYDYSINTPKCKLKGYSEYHNKGDYIEQGYILCCRYELINHIKKFRCDTIKE